MTRDDDMHRVVSVDAETFDRLRDDSIEPEPCHSLRAAILRERRFVQRDTGPLFTGDEWAEIERDKAKHRANGCRLYDDKLARCTCTPTN